MITTDWMERFLPSARLPTPATQVANLIAHIGDVMADTGEGCFIDDVVDTPLIGAFNRTMFDALLTEVRERGLVTAVSKASVPNPPDVGVLQGTLFGLSLEGWERYEAEKRGKFAGRYGFIGCCQSYANPSLVDALMLQSRYA